VRLGLGLTVRYSAVGVGVSYGRTLDVPQALATQPLEKMPGVQPLRELGGPNLFGTMQCELLFAGFQLSRDLVGASFGWAEEGLEVRFGEEEGLGRVGGALLGQVFVDGAGHGRPGAIPAARASKARGMPTPALRLAGAHFSGTATRQACAGSSPPGLMLS